MQMIYFSHVNIPFLFYVVFDYDFFPRKFFPSFCFFLFVYTEDGAQSGDDAGLLLLIRFVWLRFCDFLFSLELALLGRGRVVIGVVFIAHGDFDLLKDAEHVLSFEKFWLNMI